MVITLDHVYNNEVNRFSSFGSLVSSQSLKIWLSRIRKRLSVSLTFTKYHITNYIKVYYNGLGLL